MTTETYHWHESARNIRLNGWTVWADLQLRDGSWKERSLDLDEYLGNDNGNFKWNGRNISDSAKDPILVFWEGYPIIRASLQDTNGNYHQKDYNLSDEIGNFNGKFHVKGRGVPPGVAFGSVGIDIFSGMG
ncbi:hypothetical protein N7462_010114 [Penicillium macrosclerotiorum]|uniref:uncharacterized protein n=1 Tax=Penicillium macrosclerotiorum TaxID=303699 RepID=UPI002548D333|nr:uncharacterized protein N7462_010114 [Penicillium macrosclerotiorum]KAJ5669044.1 hypothetical protein N7462_010114 [Penicillium macrosclerotiorum]